MPRLVGPIALVALTACASAGPGPVTAPGAGRILDPSGRAAHIGSGVEAYAPAQTLAAPPARVWSALLGALAVLEVPVGAVDPALGQTSSRFLVNGRLGDAPVSRFLRCGGAMGISEVADAYQVEVRLAGVLTHGEAGATRLQLLLAGVARDRFTNTDPRSCLTTGEMEERILRHVRTALGLPLETPPTAVTAGAAPPAVTAAAPGAGRLPARGSHPALLAVGGVAGGVAGSLLGSRLGSGCERRCLSARGVLGPLVANATLIPVGVHLSNRGRGRLVQSFLASAGWAAFAAALAGYTDQEWPVWVAPPGQVITSVLIERASSR